MDNIQNFDSYMNFHRYDTVEFLVKFVHTFKLY
jgi:hypothetical protein